MANEESTRPWWMLPPGHINSLWWVGVGALLIVLTYILGPETQFPAVSVLPVSLAAWYSGPRPAVAMAVIVTAANVLFMVVLWSHSTMFTTRVVETVVRGTVIAIMGLWFARLSEHERQLHRYVVKLEGLLPICSFCKSIRNQAGDWEHLEAFISERSEAEFSHGCCPRCAETHYSALM
jgi:hypothetical protein